MMIGARFGNTPRFRQRGWESENVSPETKDGFTKAKLLLVVARVVVKLVPTVVPVRNCWE
jgi:hypothetical protein